MNIQHLEYFVALAKSEHMTHTAQALNTSQPNLSYVISELEKELGVPLFKKNGRNIRLTKYGTIFFEATQQSLKALEEGYQRIQSENDPHHGTLSVGFIYTFGASKAPTLLQEFRQDYPHVQFDLEQNNSQNLLEKLSQEALDMAIVSKVDGFEHLEFQPLTYENLVLVVPNNHPFAAREEVSLTETLSENYVYYNKHSGLRPTLDKSFADLHLNPTISIELEDDQSILGFVAQNFGIAIMPDIPSIDAYAVTKVRIKEQLSHRIIYLATRNEAYTRPIQKLFYDFCRYFFETR